MSDVADQDPNSDSAEDQTARHNNARRAAIRTAAALAAGTVAGPILAPNPAAADVPDGSVRLASFHAEAKDPAAVDAGARTLGYGPNQAAPGSTTGEHLFLHQVALNGHQGALDHMRARDVDPHGYGSIDAAGNGAHDALHAAFQAAETAGGSGVVRLRPNQTYLINGSFSLNGYSSTLQGGFGSASSHYAGGEWKITGRGTVLQAQNQTGPVLDFVGWVRPDNFYGYADFGHFTVLGDGSSGSAKVGVRLMAATTGTSSLASVYIHDMTIANTGGTALDIRVLYLSKVERLTIAPPVTAAASDIPWIRIAASNCNEFSRIGLRSLVDRSIGSCGASGAVIVTGYEKGHPEGASGMNLHSGQNLFDAWWFEYLHPVNGGTIFHCAATSNSVRNFQFVDTGSAGTDGDWPELTSFFRFVPQPTDFVGGFDGGNSITGVVPGRGTSGGAMRYGILMEQNGNSVLGTKGYRGYNVRLGSGVQRGSIRLAGSLQVADWPAVEVQGGGPLPSGVVVSDEFGGQYHPVEPASWADPPTTFAAALDQLAARITALEVDP